MNYKILKYLIFCLLFLFSEKLPAQVKNIGIPLIRNFTKEQYNAGAQSWSIVQDSRGIMYFGNSNGLLEFDGALWRTYPLPNRSTVRCVCLGPGQRVYLGGYNECGYMVPDKYGILKYNSLTKNLGNRSVGDIWKIYDSKKGIIFQSFSSVLLWDGSNLQFLLDSANLRLSFWVHGNYYVQLKGEGILRLEGKKFKLIPGSEIFKDIEIWSMLPASGNRIVIGTFNSGLYMFDGLHFTPFNNSANEFLKRNQIFSSNYLGNGILAYGTIQNGVLIINEDGKIIQHLDRQKGLQNNTVLTVFADANKNLWLGLDNGIDYVETNSPVSHLVQKKEIGAGYSALIYNKYIYFGTNQGLFRKLWTLNDNGEKIEKIENTQGQVWSLYEYNNTLLCGHDKGTFIINGLNAQKISSIEGVWKFLEVPGKENLLLQGTYSGMSVIFNSGGRWVFRNSIKGFHSSARFIEIDEHYNVWISYGNGVYRFRLNESLDSVSFSKYYSYKDGLPYNVNVIKLDQHLLFNTDEGIYQYNYNTDRFEPSPDFFNVFKTKSVSRIFKGFDNLYWFISHSEPGVLLKHLDGRYSIENTPLRKISGSFIQSFENIIQIDHENVIMSVEDGFMHYNPLFRTNYLQMPKCFIRQVALANDSILYGGNDIASGNNINRKPAIRYSHNALKFVFISNAYTDGGKTVFRYMLENFDKSWSDWGTQTHKEYTNIPEGTYIFKVVARNIYGIQSTVASYKFSISPPWYRSFYAYLIYIVLIVTALSFWFYRLQNKFEREKQTLKIRQKKILEEKEMQHAQEVMQSQQEIVKLRNEMLELENERSRTEVELKKKELASLATQITRKNEILERIKLQLNKLSGSIKAEDKKKLSAIIKSIDQDIHIDEDWEKFEHYFDQVHGDFIKRLRERFPSLTPTDLKLCAYLKMNISSKEIAPLLNISVRSVEVSRYRLRKKLNLSPTDNLVDFMLSV